MYKSILVPIDLAHDSSWQRSLPVAAALARAFGSRLHVMTVVRDIDAMLDARYFAGVYERMIDETAGRLSSLVQRQLPPELGAETSVGQGAVYDDILRTAEKLQIDLIVMASHRPEMKDYLLGANAARVVRHARCSVFVVRE
jgi:nucleotide-binding universal stress UspA family protein